MTMTSRAGRQAVSATARARRQPVGCSGKGGERCRGTLSANLRPPAPRLAYPMHLGLVALLVAEVRWIVARLKEMSELR
jgi:hypothetical protein